MNPREEVTERILGLYGIADAQAAHGQPLPIVRAMLRGGCRLIQLRCKEWTRERTRPVAIEALRLCEARRATFILNDDPELAAEIGAHGVHLGQGDMSTQDARAIVGPRCIIGRSSHSAEQAELATEHADYVAFGPVYPSDNAGDHKSTRGLAALREVRGVVPWTHPLVAIGGIHADRLVELQGMGVDSWAIIGFIHGAASPEAATRRMLA